MVMNGLAQFSDVLFKCVPSPDTHGDTSGEHTKVQAHE